MMPIVHLAGYRFVSLPAPADWRAPIQARCNALALRGTILLAPEGINLFIAGVRAATDAFSAWLRSAPLFAGRFADLQFKTSFCAAPPFQRMLVKVRKEIITLRTAAVERVQPQNARAPAIDAHTLKTWLDRGCDDKGRPVALLDTRNGFEVDLGTFASARDYRLTKFSDFPHAINAARADFAGKTVVSFCTGGIRCEKAALYMQHIGIDSVYQLEGGILKYFEAVGGAHYRGDCFVFDRRIALNTRLEPVTVPQPVVHQR